MRYAAAYIILIIISIQTSAQHQFIVVKKHDVVLRFDQGDDFFYKLKGDKKKREGFVRAIRQDTVFLWRDTIPVIELKAVYQNRKRFHNTIGSFLVVAGVTYFLLDQANNTIVAGNKPSIDNNILITSAVLTGTGLPLSYFNRKIHRKGRKFRFLTSGPGSPFYLDPRMQKKGFSIPY